MSALPILLAEAESGVVFAAWRLASPLAWEGIAIFGALGLVTLVILLWAIYFRKRRRRRSHHHSRQGSSEPADSPKPGADEHVSPQPQIRRKHRRLRRKYRSRNPTLAETGGLPPIRPESPSGPPS